MADDLSLGSWLKLLIPNSLGRVVLVIMIVLTLVLEHLISLAPAHFAARLARGESMDTVLLIFLLDMEALFRLAVWTASGLLSRAYTVQSWELTGDERDQKAIRKAISKARPGRLITEYLRLTACMISLGFYMSGAASDVAMISLVSVVGGGTAAVAWYFRSRKMSRELLQAKKKWIDSGDALERYLGREVALDNNLLSLGCGAWLLFVVVRAAFWLLCRFSGKEPRIEEMIIHSKCLNLLVELLLRCANIGRSEAKSQALVRVLADMPLSVSRSEIEDRPRLRSNEHECRANRTRGLDALEAQAGTKHYSTFCMAFAA